MLKERTDPIPREDAQTPRIVWVPTRELLPHPRQATIYGEEDVSALVADVRTSGWIKPLVVTHEQVILSGHRRWKVACLLEWPTIPVEYRTCADEGEEIATLLLENRYREKTAEQRVREGNAWGKIEHAQARHRMSEAVKRRWQGIGQENFPDLASGQSRDNVAERVGFGTGRTYEKAEQVVNLADRLATDGNVREARALLSVLNAQSVDAAARLLKLPQAEQRAALEKIATGQATKAQEAIVAVKHEAVVNQYRDLPDPPRIELAPWDTWLPQQPLCDLLLTDPPYSTDIEQIEAFAGTWLPAALTSVNVSGRAFVCVGGYPRELRAYLNAPVPSHLRLLQVLVWTYTNTIGPSPASMYKQNWQAILYFIGLNAPKLDGPLLTEQFAVQEINAPDGRQGERFHRWQKPDALAERLIRHSTRPGDVVYDPFAGTGTFLLAAARLGRVARGCERDVAMATIAEQRGCQIQRGWEERAR